ncbi:hypothetical protein BZG02_05200 [Labilibaculum filiforme]|uniref:ABC3 transporter permease protein domain-containing protein n=1 Tax=Labilibaculum filiforme TaxID=1940526 RepID=A0A2N3I1P4_9BACT|nr:ABC transporter permease [Labilibaculum filiforme]PKQ64220.1 hypothetical protein BZG02_05200 [Labilibaculum filiforme]
MIKNYIKSALRNLKQNYVFTGINIVGLSIALAASFIIILFVINEFSYNNCHNNRKTVYRVLNYYKGFDRTLTGTPYILASTLKEEFPQIEHAINIRDIKDLTIRHKGEDIQVKDVIGSSSEVFDIFTLPLINGKSTKTLLSDKNSICLSSSLANKIFSGTDAIGKEIVATINKQEHVLTVTAVFEDIPKNSTFRAECLVNDSFSITYFNKKFETINAETSWEENYWQTWVRLIPGSNPSLIDSQFAMLENKYMGENPVYHYTLQNLSDVYLGSEKVINNSIQGNWNSIEIFSAIALLIVLVAMINYIILSTAVSSGQSKEIGIRKTFGAKNNQIKCQLLTESVLLTMIVLPLAIAFMILGLPCAEELFQTNLPIIEANILYYILFYFILTVSIGIISGLYTSVGLSKLTILNVLKNQNLAGRKKSYVRSSLIIFQLVIFCFFVASALVIRAQYQYSLEKNPGFHNKNVLLIDINDSKNYTPFLNEIQANSNVIMASGAYSGLPTYSFMAMMLPHHQDREKKVEVEGMSVDFGFLQTMGISLTEGRYFSTDYGSDLANSCILNEMAVKALGIKDPIGKKIGEQTIVGIVNNFHLHSFRSDIPPLKISLTEKYLKQIAIYYSDRTGKDLIPMLEKSWEKIAPEQAFSYSTVEEIIEGMYSEEKSRFSLVSIFAFFTMLIASFGLFGLTLFIAKTRTKEIGIKKVLGCSDTIIILSFLRINILYVAIASFISIPITFYAMTEWLSEYSVRTEIHWWIFALSFLFAGIVVTTTVFIHAYRVSKLNPIESLRYE